VEYLDNDRMEISFKNEHDEVKIRIFNIKEKMFE
jgi:hypothetical protein